MKPPKSNISSCLKGDQRAQKNLYDQLKGKVMGVCYRYNKSKDDAEDIFQEAMIRIFNNLHKALEVDNFNSWISRITVNVAIDHFNRRRSNLFVEIDQLEMMQFDSQETSALQNMEATEILNLIYQLPDHYRIVFNLSMIEGYDHKYIAKQLNIAESTSRVILTRARRRLIELLQKKTYYENIAG